MKLRKSAGQYKEIHRTRTEALNTNPDPGEVPREGTEQSAN